MEFPAGKSWWVGESLKVGKECDRLKPNRFCDSKVEGEVIGLGRSLRDEVALREIVDAMDGD